MFWTLIAILFVLYLCWKCSKTFSYWRLRDVLQPNFNYILWSNWQMIGRSTTLADITIKEYNLFPNARFSGGYQMFAPTLLLRNPEIIKQITVKDFDHFVDHQTFITEDADPLWGKNLFSLTGERWREMRATLSPSFTSSKMKAMFVLISECAERLTNHFEQANKDTIELEMKDVFTRYANDVIASSAFGITCDSLAKRDNEFYLMGKDASDFSGFGINLKFFISSINPNLIKFLGMRFFSNAVVKFFTNLIKETIRIREKEGTVRPDMIHLLMEARKGRLKYDEKSENQNETGFATVEESAVGKVHDGISKREITDEDITAQALIFFLAGFDTVSTAMSFMAHELAVNPDIQQKLYEEITQTLDDSQGKVTYDMLMKMKYLDMVVSETLRKWPPGIVSDRVCDKAYTIKPETQNEKPLHIEKGLIVVIPQFAIHRDEKYYPEPERFDPERFNDENKNNIDPYTYMPFGLGPRNCIGSRFALLEIKAVFVRLLSKFEIVASDKTQIPIQLCKSSLSLDSEKGFWVGLKRRTI